MAQGVFKSVVRTIKDALILCYRSQFMIHPLGVVPVLRHAIRHNEAEHSAVWVFVVLSSFLFEACESGFHRPSRGSALRGFALHANKFEPCPGATPSPALGCRKSQWSAKSAGLVAAHAENMPRRRRGSSSFIDTANECLTFQAFTAEQNDHPSGR